MQLYIEIVLEPVLVLSSTASLGHFYKNRALSRVIAVKCLFLGYNAMVVRFSHIPRNYYQQAPV